MGGFLPNPCVCRISWVYCPLQQALRAEQPPRLHARSAAQIIPAVSGCRRRSRRRLPPAAPYSPGKTKPYNPFVPGSQHPLIEFMPSFSSPRGSRRGAAEPALYLAFLRTPTRIQRSLPKNSCWNNGAIVGARCRGLGFSPFHACLFPPAAPKAAVTTHVCFLSSPVVFSSLYPSETAGGWGGKRLRIKTLNAIF